MTEIEVHPGDIFTAGHHKFLCGDIEKDDCAELLGVPQKIYMVYSDPPWNPGNAKMWRTLANLDGNTGKKVEWRHFVNRFCERILYADPTHVFIEMGVKQTPDYINIAFANGLMPLCGIWNVFYSYTHPNRLLYFSEVGGFTGNPEGLKNEPMTRHVFEHIVKPGEVVFDPCVGLGMTARMAHRFGMVCYGIELNPRRLEKTLMWLSKQGYEINAV